MPLKASGLRKAASNAIKASGGTDVIMRRVTTAAYNTTTGAVSESNSDTTISALIEEVNAREVNELVQADDRKATIPAASLSSVPSTSDRVLIGGVNHQIITIETITDGGTTAVTYELFLRT